MHKAEVIAHVPRDCRPPQNPACACGLLQLGYEPERRIGSITHGALVCLRHEPEEKP